AHVRRNPGESSVPTRSRGVGQGYRLCAVAALARLLGERDRAGTAETTAAAAGSLPDQLEEVAGDRAYQSADMVAGHDEAGEAHDVVLGAASATQDGGREDRHE